MNNLSLFLLKKISLTAVVLLLLGCLGGAAVAQVPAPADTLSRPYYVDRYLVNVGGSGLFPLGVLNEHFDPRIGAYLGGYLRLPQQFPLFVGFDIETGAFAQYTETYFLTDVDGFTFEASERSRSSFFQAHLALRVQPFVDFWLHPYAEVLVGGKHFYTRTRIRDLDAPSDDDVISNTGRSGDWTVSFGGRVGFNIPLLVADTGGIELDVSAAYLRGGIVRYAAPLDEIDFTNYIDTFDAFDLVSTTSDMWNIRLGLLLYFGG